MFRVPKGQLWLLLVGLSTLGAAAARAQAKVGQKPPNVVLTGDDGGKVAGGKWDSGEIHGKLFVLFYVDPDHADTNEHVAKALKKANFPLRQVGTMAVVNMDATWLPNFAIKRKLKAKQKKYTSTLYVMDKRKVLVKRWKLKDDASDVLLFDAKGQVLFRHDGKLPGAQVTELLATIRKHLPKP